MKQYPLPKSSLLRKTWEYDLVYKRGRRLQGNNFSLICMANEGSGNRLGISVHGRLKGAVRRNRIKRVIKEFFRANRTVLPPAMDIVITVRRGFAPRTPAEVQEAVRDLLDRISRRGPRSGTEQEERRKTA
jgi:ribonuclease P protein component